MKKLRNFVLSKIKRMYISYFSKPSHQKGNDYILSLCLKSRGYNNCCDYKLTGEREFLRILSKTNPKLCIDVGANKGDISRILLSNSRTNIFAFEPLPSAYQKLLSLKEEFPERITLFPCGIGDRNAIATLRHGDDDSELATFSSEVSEIDYVGEVNTNKMNVEMKTLDSLIGRFQEKAAQIDFLKVDTEGYELEVLIGAKKTIEIMKPKFVQIEFNLHHLFRNQTLKSLAQHLPGYSAFQLLPYKNGMIPRDLKTAESNIYSYANFVFIRQGNNL